MTSDVVTINNPRLVVNRLRLKQVLIMLPLHREGLTSYLSPLLGQYGIRNNEFLLNFITKFNNFTNNIFAGDVSVEDIELGLSDEELVIPIILDVYKAGKYEITIQHPQIGSTYGIRFKQKRRFYRKKIFYRNYKKIFQLVFFKIFKSGLPVLAQRTQKIHYLEIRNSLYRKD